MGIVQAIALTLDFIILFLSLEAIPVRVRTSVPVGQKHAERLVIVLPLLGPFSMNVYTLNVWLFMII
jgi:hypothetical protein